MKTLPPLILVLVSTLSSAEAQTIRRDVPYVEAGHPRQLLDLYAPAGAKGLPDDPTTTALFESVAEALKK